MRNPAWNRDELLLALDLYWRSGGAVSLSNQSPDVIQLSELLNQLPGWRQADARYRNVNSVYMKLMNFRRLDPAFEGKGLARGNRLEEEIWNEFEGRREELHHIADTIRALITSGSAALDDEEPDDEEFAEGRVLYRLHRRYERNKAVIARAKTAAIKRTGKLACEICQFDFVAAYGERGTGYIEAHHTVPVSHLTEQGKTRISDLLLLCANCHRIVHRTRPWLTAAQLRECFGLERRR